MTDNIINLKPFIDSLQAAERNREEYLFEREQQQRETEEQLEDWDRYLASRGLTEDDGPEDPDGAFISKVDREVNMVLAEFEALVNRQVRDQEDALAALDDIRRALDPQSSVPARQVRDPHPDEPLTLFEVVCLPELGGQLYVGKDLPGTPSPNITVKTLRGAISRGQLAVLRPNDKNMYVTRTMIKEWLEGCREKPKNPTSSNESPATTKRASSPTKAPGSSSTEASKLRRDAVSQLAKRLR
ncbi:hypothetical protein [Rhizobium lentis]|uniref:Uncharacterized protein n=1 Tax=Rhizobium lentis TaxID=1138194 RepID=A0A9Q3M7L2_9HYPH|nr:hypothetical protein [Rhizobium lentis]MBX5021146.1 hypothetical protein [Rhizobium lentis]